MLANKGVVQGAVIGTPNGDVTIRARRATILASGGFPNDIDRRREMFPRTPTGKEHWSLAPESTSGDGLRLGEAVGGQVDRSLASPVAWAPVSLVPHRDESVGHFPHIIDRAKPGIIGVLADGRRFVNEADGYYDYVAAMVRAVPEGQEVASWLICAHAAQRRYSLGFAKPAPCRLRLTCAPATSRAGVRSRSWRASAASILQASSVRSKNTIGTPGMARTLSSAAARRPITAMEAIPIRSPIPASRRSSTGPSTQSRFCQVASVPSPA